LQCLGSRQEIASIEALGNRVHAYRAHIGQERERQTA
jgi:hypothetical protein